MTSQIDIHGVVMPCGADAVYLAPQFVTDAVRAASDAYDNACTRQWAASTEADLEQARWIRSGRRWDEPRVGPRHHSDRAATADSLRAVVLATPGAIRYRNWYSAARYGSAPWDGGALPSDVEVVR